MQRPNSYHIGPSRAPLGLIVVIRGKCALHSRLVDMDVRAHHSTRNVLASGQKMRIRCSGTTGLVRLSLQLLEEYSMQ